MYPDTEALASKFSVGKEFAEGALRFFTGDDAFNKKDAAAYAHSEAFIEYALSSNSRGRELFKEVVGDTSRSLKILDIGCAYGGMIHACTEAGHDALGLEIDQNVANMGRLNLEGLNSSAVLRVGDFLSYDFQGAMFDVIVCTDVIEHVQSPRNCLKRIYDLLSPGGVAHLETVNRRSAINVAADIHMGHFGITLLDHHSASAAAKQMSGWSDYQVTEFYDLDWYLGLGRAFGAHMEMAQPPTYWQVTDVLKSLFERYSSWKSTHFHKLDEFLQHEIEVSFARYCQRLFSAREASVESSGDAVFLRDWVSPVIKFKMVKA